MSRKRRKQGGIYDRLQTQYRIVFINDESLEEVATFRLTIRKLYVLFSTLFVVIVGLTICVLLLTPLKYYIPGYGSNKTHMQVIRLKENVDSLSDLVSAQQNYEANIRKVINGSYNGKSDTTKLSDKVITKEANKVIFPVEKK
ncbi:MAG: hypothetical protein JSS96_17595 [Bacteroidetes bacterium]|nr:hypothetical protein [Bacteroidota bacterium]